MKGFLTTHKGMEDIAALEVKELIGSTAKISEACIAFNINNYEDLFKLCYKSQSAIGICYLLQEFNYSSIFNDFKKNIITIKFNEWLGKKTAFRVKCAKNYGSSIQTPKIETKLGEIVIGNIQKKHGYSQKVSLENPEIIILVYLTKGKCFVGIDFAGFDLSKRPYKIFSHPADIKGTIAYSLVRLSDCNKNEALLDPFSGSGTIPIEAALFTSSIPVNFFSKEKFIFLKFKKFKDFDFSALFKKLDKEMLHGNLKIYNLDSSMKHINYAKKNSKIAGIDKKISFSRMNIEWLDTKFEKSKMGSIATIMPSLRAKDIDKLYNEFFYQAEFILNKKGKIALIGDKLLVKKYSEKHKFAIFDQRNVFSGKKEYEIFVLNK